MSLNFFPRGARENGCGIRRRGVLVGRDREVLVGDIFLRCCTEGTFTKGKNICKLMCSKILKLQLSRLLCVNNLRGNAKNFERRESNIFLNLFTVIQEGQYFYEFIY